MDTGLVSRIIKARQYAQETDRVEFAHLEVRFKGDHNTTRLSTMRVCGTARVRKLCVQESAATLWHSSES